ncbi:hypothetical protein, partial [Rhizobium leguminosarum]|uniref:hypothetical protein n=1 Tax=Rhizobium leguminosarum TaxID=384 RepID=UPI003F99C39B
TRSPAVSSRRENGGWTVFTKINATGETRTFRAKCLVNCAGPGQLLAAAEMIVEEEAEPNEP